jgi:energy-converting hydrogenase Eha subunit B
MAAQFAGELLQNGASNTSMAGASSATVTGTNVEAAGEIIFHPDGSAIANSQIVATSRVTTAAGTASTIVTLPDGTVITLVGLAAVTPVLFTP